MDQVAPRIKKLLFQGVASQCAPWLAHKKFDLVVKSGVPKNQTIVRKRMDHEGALVWGDKRFRQVLTQGPYACWTGEKPVRVETIDARTVRIEQEPFKVTVRSPLAWRVLDICNEQCDHAGVLFINGRFADTLSPDASAFWKSPADKVTPRLNDVVTFKIADARRAVGQIDNVCQVLCREIAKGGRSHPDVAA